MDRVLMKLLINKVSSLVEVTETIVGSPKRETKTKLLN